MADHLPALVLPHRVDVEGCVRFASSEGSNFSSLSMSAALGAVPLVVSDSELREAVALELLDFELPEAVAFGALGLRAPRAG